MHDLIFASLLTYQFVILYLLLQKHVTGVIPHLIYAFLLFICKIYLLTFAAGIFGLLTPLNLGILWLVTVLAEHVLLYKMYNKSKLLSLEAELIVKVKEFASEVICATWYTKLLTLVFLGMLAYVITAIFLLQPYDVDGLSYHLGYVAQARQFQGIFNFDSGYIWIEAYPKTIELLQLFYGVLNPRGNMIEAMQIPFLFLGMISIFDISRYLGSKRKFAYLAALSLILAPLIYNQLRTSYVDVTLHSMSFAFLAMALRQTKLTRSFTIMTAICFGFIIGIKSSGLLIIMVLLLTVFVVKKLYQVKLLKQFFSEFSTKLDLLKILLSATALFFLIGGIWYTRVALEYGNPIYPFQIEVLGKELPGYFKLDLFKTAYPEVVLERNLLDRVDLYASEQLQWAGCLYNYDSIFAGYGPNWSVLFIPAIFFALFVIDKTRRREYVVLLLGAGLLWALTPASWYGRYTLFSYYYGAIAFAVVLTRAKSWLRYFLLTVFLFNAAYIVLMSYHLCSASPGFLIQTLNRDKYLDHPYNTHYDHAFRGEGKKIALTSRNWVLRYPLWGYEWQNEVYELNPASQIEAEQMLADLDADLYYIEKQNVEFIQELEGYEIIFDDDYVRVYEKQ